MDISRSAVTASERRGPHHRVAADVVIDYADAFMAWPRLQR